LWDFGDGTYSVQKNPVHAYYRAGVYTVTLTAGSPTHGYGVLSKINYVTVEGTGINMAQLIINLLIEQFRRDKQKLHGFLNSVAIMVQDIEDSLTDLKRFRGIISAEGTSLDLIGDIVGCPRTSVDDDIYRADIYFQIAINNSKGTAEELITALKRISGASAVDFSEGQPATITLTINDTIDIPLETIIARLNKIRPAGVKLILKYTHGNTPFIFGGEGSSPPYFSSGSGFGETGAGWETVGGNIVELIS
jgi:PKD repeat protein